MPTPEEVDEYLRQAGLPTPDDPSNEGVNLDTSKLPTDPEHPYATNVVPVEPLPEDAQTAQTPEHAEYQAEAELRDAERKARANKTVQAVNDYYDPHSQYMREGSQEPEAPAPQPEAEDEDLFDPHNQYMREQQAGAKAPAPPPPPPKAESKTEPPGVDALDAAKKLDAYYAPLATEIQKQGAPPPEKPKEWYEQLGPPPKTSSTMGVLGSLGIGILGALLARKDPAVAAGMAGLGGLGALQAAIDQPQREYQNRLAAGERQAKMRAQLDGTDDGDGLGAQRLALAREKWAKQQEDAARELAEHEALEKMDSPETLAERKIIRDWSVGPDGKLLPGGLTDQQINSMNGNQIRKYKVGLEHQAQQARSNQYNIQAGNRHELARAYAEERAENRQIAKEGREEQRTMSKEEREQLALNERAAIPGAVMIGKRAPSQHATDKARSIMDAMGRAHLAASELHDLLNTLNEGRLAGNMYKYLVNDPEGKQALADAQRHQSELRDAQRELSELGVLQHFEKKMVEETNPEVGSLQEFFMGRFNYNAYLRLLPKYARKRLKVYDYDLAPDSEFLANQPQFGQEKEAKVSDIIEGTLGRAQDTVKKVGDAVQQVAPGAAAPAAAATEALKTATKNVKIWNPRTNSYGPVKPYTEAQINEARARAKAKGYPDNAVMEVP